jgi:hypothetical protein
MENCQLRLIGNEIDEKWEGMFRRVANGSDPRNIASASIISFCRTKLFCSKPYTILSDAAGQTFTALM